MRILLTLCLIGLTTMSAANAPDASVRPSLRDAATAQPERARLIRVSTSKLAPARSQRPNQRYGKPLKVRPQTDLSQLPQQVSFAKVLSGGTSPRPMSRPTRVSPNAIGTPRNAQQQQAGLFNRKKKRGVKGSVCGVPGISGAKIAPIRGRIRGCGVRDPVAVTSVAGVGLSTPAKIDCGTAKALHAWVEKTAKPAVGKLGGGLSQLTVAAHYACRTRNNKSGAKISEHGKGRAIDISALTLKNGKRITVLNGWGRGVEGRILKKLHKGACGPFGTVLGPNADRFHRDHFHFDTARYRSGAYCR